jgi:hypothetical protein
MPKSQPPHFPTIRYEVLDEFYRLHEYVTSMEATLREEYQARAARYEEMTRNLEPGWSDDIEEDPIEYLYSGQNDAWDQYRVKFAQILRQSAFISGYALLEQGLFRVCDYFEQAMPHEISRRDLAHKGIEQAKTYLLRVARVPFPNTGKRWQQITNYGKLRNLLVHSGPRLDSERKAKAAEELAQGMTASMAR